MATTLINTYTQLTMDEESEIITAQKIRKVAFANIPTCTKIRKQTIESVDADFFQRFGTSHM